jgi:hypothetical protein
VAAGDAAGSPECRNLLPMLRTNGQVAEQKKAALRAVIVRTAVHLFLERGYDAVGMEEIAAASMCSRSTLNRYFGTKEDVLLPAVPEVVDGLRRAECRWRGR